MRTQKLAPVGVPMAVTLYAALPAVIGLYLGLVGLVDPTKAVGYQPGAEMIAGAWAGRTLGLALIMALAIWMRNAAAYALAFLGSACREFGDVVGALNAGLGGTLAVLLVFLLLDLVGLVLSARKVFQGPAPAPN